MLTMNDNEVKALIQLIDDPDDHVFTLVEAQILNYGEQIIPRLEGYYQEQNFGFIFHSRIENIIHKIQFDKTCKRLEDWERTDCKNLLDGALIIAEYQYPGMNRSEIDQVINRIRQDIWLEINDQLTALEITRVFNHVFFELHGLKGNKEDRSDPQNAYLNCVIESRKGNPLSLSILYLVIAKQLDIPLCGINMPNYFLLGYLDEYHTIQQISGNPGDGIFPIDDQPILFYISPFSEGAMIHKSELVDYLEKLGIAFDEHYFKPCSNRQIVRQLIQNLIDTYEGMEQLSRVADLNKLLSLLHQPPLI